MLIFSNHVLQITQNSLLRLSRFYLSLVGVGMLTILLEGTCTESAVDSVRLLCKSFLHLASSRGDLQGLVPIGGTYKPLALLGVLETLVTLPTEGREAMTFSNLGSISTYSCTPPNPVHMHVC